MALAGSASGRRPGHASGRFTVQVAQFWATHGAHDRQVVLHYAIAVVLFSLDIRGGLTGGGVDLVQYLPGGFDAGLRRLNAPRF
jgi:hypothetical protein